MASYLSFTSKRKPMTAPHELERACLGMTEVNRRELQEECASKLVPYRRNKLYVYLRSVQYGTDAYQRSGLIRFLDGWIARLCNYHVNLQNELTLLAMQDALSSEEVTRR